MATTASCTQIPQNTTNVVTFPEKYNDQLEPNHDHDNNNNHACARARAWREVLDAYEDVMGRPMPRFVQSECEGFERSGVQLDMIKAVIEYTACAPRPSWAYARTVLYRSEERGIRTAADFMTSLGMRGRAGDADLPY